MPARWLLLLLALLLPPPGPGVSDRGSAARGRAGWWPEESGAAAVAGVRAGPGRGGGSGSGGRPGAAAEAAAGGLAVNHERPPPEASAAQAGSGSRARDARDRSCLPKARVPGAPPTCPAVSTGGRRLGRPRWPRKDTRSRAKRVETGVGNLCSKVFKNATLRNECSWELGTASFTQCWVLLTCPEGFFVFGGRGLPASTLVC